MSTDPAPFQVGFDLYDPDHCASVTEAAIDALPEHLAVRFDRKDTADLIIEDAHQLLAELGEDGDEGDLVRLGELVSVLRWCADGSCPCGEFAWGDQRDELNGRLEMFGERLWALWRSSRRSRERFDDRYALLSVESVFDLLSWRDGWSAVTLRWDGTELEASFRGCDGWYDAIVAVPLDPVREEAWMRASGRRGDHIATAADLLEIDGQLVAAASELDDTELVAGWWDALERLRSANLDRPTLRLVCALAADWEGSLDELFDAARTITSTAGEM